MRNPVLGASQPAALRPAGCSQRVLGQCIWSCFLISCPVTRRAGTQTKVGRGVEASQRLSCHTLPLASPMYEEGGKAGAGNARVTGGKTDPEGGQDGVGKILGKGSFMGTWPHCAAVRCLTPPHPTLPPLTATEFLQRSQKNPP